MKINYCNGKGSVMIDQFGYIEQLRVPEEHRRQGVGTKLVHMAIECKPHLNRFTAFCNKYSQVCFTRNGFKLIHEHADNFEEDGLTYTFCEMTR